MRSCQYNDFEIAISGDGPPYPVSASYRGLSATASFGQDALSPHWQEALALLTDPHNSQGEPLLAEIGGQLFQALFQGDLWEMWSQARSDLDDGGRLRIRLGLRPPAVAALPWELLHDPRRNQPFAADGAIALVRVQNAVGYVARPRALAASLPLRVLLVAVEDPQGLALDAEIARVRAGIERLPPGRMALELLTGRVTIHEIRQALLASDADILHVISHGSADGLLLWAGDEPALVSAAALQATLQQAEAVKLAFLNACLAGQVDSQQPFAGVALRLLQSGLPAVVAMAYEILDATAVEFAGYLYEALVTGPCPGYIDAAVSVARNNLYISQPERVGYATPILWLNAPDGCIFPFDTDPFETSERAATPPEEQPAETQPDTHPNTQPARFVPQQPQVDFALAEKEQWLASLPEEIPHPGLQLDYSRRRRNIYLLLQKLAHEAEEQQQGARIDVRKARTRLEIFADERRYIENILSLPDSST